MSIPFEEWKEKKPKQTNNTSKFKVNIKIKLFHLPNNMPANPVKDNKRMTVRLSPLFSVPNTTPMKKMTSVHCNNTITDWVKIWANNNSGVVIPAKNKVKNHHKQFLCRIPSRMKKKRSVKHENETTIAEER